MKREELEKELSVRWNTISFYEYKKLIALQNGEIFSTKEVTKLKKIIILRKLGFEIDEIARMKNGVLKLQEILENHIECLAEEGEAYIGAIEVCQKLQEKHLEYESIDVLYFWEFVREQEDRGKNFKNIQSDMLQMGDVLDDLLQRVFFKDITTYRREKGILYMVGIMLLLCIVRGLGNVFVWQESFLEGFLSPLFVCLMVMVMIIPLFLLGKKMPKLAGAIATVFIVSAVLFLGAIILFIVWAMVTSIFTK